MTTAPIPLTDLPIGTVARLERRDVDDESGRLLSALGLSVTRRLRLCTDREPYIVQLQAARIGLSAAVARNLYVKIDPPGGA